MNTFFATLTPMLTLFACIATGFALSKCKILPESSSKVMARLETWIFCPALSFMTMVRFCTVESIGLHLTNIILALAGVVLAISMAILLARFFVKEKSAERDVYTYALAFANAGYAGDPIVLALFGDVVLSYYKLFYLPFSLAINSWGVGILMPRTEQNGSFWKRLLNPPTIAMVAGIVMGLSGLGECLPTFFVNTLDSLKVCMGPVAMLLAGVTIAKYDFLAMLKKKKVYVVTGLRLVVLPIVMVAFIFGLKTLANAVLGTSINNDVLFLAFFGTATALGLNTVVFPEAYGGNPETGASMAMISHTLCILSIPLMYALMVAVFGVPFQ